LQAVKDLYYGLLVACIVTLFLRIRQLPSYCKWLLLLLLTSLGTQVIQQALSVPGVHAYFVFHIYQPIEFILLCIFYYEIFDKRLYKRITWVLGSLYILSCLVYYFFRPQSFNKGDFTDFTLESVMVCGLVVLYFIQMLEIKEKIELKHFMKFWLNALHLVFYGGCLFTMGFYYYLTKTDSLLARQILNINHFLNLLLYSGYLIVFACTKAART